MLEERIVELACVIQVEDAAAQLVDLVVAPDMGVSHGDGRVAVGAPQRERRDHARRIGKWIEPGKLRIEAGGAQAVGIRELPVELQRVLILGELGRNDVALPDEGIAPD